MTPDGQFAADFEITEEIAMEILRMFEEEQIPVGYGVLALGLALGRLQKPREQMAPELEITFIQTLLEWLGAYFADESVVH